MTIRDKIRKLEVLEQIILTIEACEASYREEAKRYRERAAETLDDYWNGLAVTSEAKADYFHSYKVMLMEHEIK